MTTVSESRSPRSSCAWRTTWSPMDPYTSLRVDASWETSRYGLRRYLPRSTCGGVAGGVVAGGVVAGGVVALSGMPVAPIRVAVAEILRRRYFGGNTSTLDVRLLPGRLSSG